MARLGVFAALLGLIWQQRAWWMAPIILVLVLIAGLALLTSASPLAPFLYPLF